MAAGGAPIDLRGFLGGGAPLDHRDEDAEGFAGGPSALDPQGPQDRGEGVDGEPWDEGRLYDGAPYEEHAEEEGAPGDRQEPQGQPAPPLVDLHAGLPQVRHDGWQGPPEGQMLQAVGEPHRGHPQDQRQPATPGRQHRED